MASSGLEHLSLVLGTCRSAAYGEANPGRPEGLRDSATVSGRHGRGLPWELGTLPSDRCSCCPVASGCSLACSRAGEVQGAEKETTKSLGGA